MRLLLRPRRLTWLLFALTVLLLLISYQPAEGLLQSAPTGTTTATATALQTSHTRTPTATSTPLGQSTTGTPRPTKVRLSSPTPSLPPPEEIGSTNGIVGWGVIMVALILAVILWHRPDWARRRTPH
jgi:hypothetical protein